MTRQSSELVAAGQRVPMTRRHPSLDEALADNEHLQRELEAARERVSVLEAELRAAQRLEAIGRVASGIAHDFSNVIAVISGYADLLLRRVDPADPVRASVESIKKATTWGQQLTQHVIASGRPPVVAPAAVDLNSVTRSVVRTLAPLFGDHIHVVTRLDAGLGLVNVGLGQLEQVVMNLLINARDALAGGGRLTVETSAIALDRGAGRPSLPGVRLRVSDTGIGMDSATRSRAFEPYFTTKEPGKGTGLGLSTVFGIVTQHGGQVDVMSEVGEGSTFTVYLPCAEVTPPADEPTVPRPATTDTVLVVEDEPGVRDLVVEILEMAGFKTVVARDANEAVAASHRHAGPMPLVIADVSAPGVRGELFVERLRAFRPEMKVLYLSGDLADLDDAGTRPDVRAMIHKPFTLDGLMRRVREVLVTS